MMPKRVRFVLPAAVLALIAGLYLLSRPTPQSLPRQNLGLMTSLPIYWGDAADFAAIASGQNDTPWVRTALEERFDLIPLDSLVAEDSATLPHYDRLIIAQPRALTPQDNVALDDWVNNGGRLLLVIDPLLTGSYSVPLGDPAHPVSVGLLPPVLERWGLGIRYDESQPFELQSREDGGVEIQFAMAGEIFLLGPSPGTCVISHEGLLAQCKLGKGRITLLADAALFEFQEESRERRKSLSKLVEFAFQ